MKRWLFLPVALVACCLAGANYAQEDEEGPKDRSPRLVGTGVRPVGVWEQTTDDYQITLKLEPDRLHLTVSAKGSKTDWVVDADYSVTKDSIVYGIVTSVDGSKSVVRVEGGKEGERLSPVATPIPASPSGSEERIRTTFSPAADEAPRAAPVPKPAQLDVAIDDLFSFRYRVDDEVLTIKDMKWKGVAGKGDLVLQGRFKNTEEKTPLRRNESKTSEERNYPPPPPVLPAPVSKPWFRR
jgi:hypothetical protein